MITIKDTEGKYEIHVDTTRKIAFQKHNGMFKKDVLDRMDKDYREKVLPLFRGKKWAKCCDLRNYIIGGEMTEDMNKHNSACIEAGMSDVALIVDSATTKMQMNRAGRKINFAPVACLDETEANSYLRTKGY